jgi:hypothetical protein
MTKQIKFKQLDSDSITAALKQISEKDSGAFYTLPTAAKGTLGGVKTTSSVTSTSGLTACPIIGGVPYYKDTNTTYSAATTSAAGLMSASDKKKLDNIDEGATAYTLPTASSSTLGGVKTTSTVTSTSGLTACPIISGVPYYNNTTYSDATTSASGLMSATDKNKLNGIDAGANKYTLPTASSSTLGGVKTTSTVTSTSGYTACPIISGVPYYKNAEAGATYSEATTSTAGLMSASDKSKLDGVAVNANNYSHPTYTSYSSGLYKVTVNSYGHVSSATAVTKSDITDLGIPSSNTTYTAGQGLSLSSTTFSITNLNSSTVGTVCVRQMSAGTSDASTTNCPSGCWYGKYSD